MTAPLVGSRKRILSRTKLAPDSQTTGVSSRPPDNADHVIRGLPDKSFPSTLLVRFAR
jgi:hypothetical protein